MFYFNIWWTTPCSSSHCLPGLGTPPWHFGIDRLDFESGLRVNLLLDLYTLSKDIWHFVLYCLFSYLPCWYDGGARTHRITISVSPLMPVWCHLSTYCHIPPGLSLWSLHCWWWGTDQIRTECCDRVSDQDRGPRQEGIRHRRRELGPDLTRRKRIRPLFIHFSRM